jgi:uncharacterized protein (DUF2147 family)
MLVAASLAVAVVSAAPAAAGDPTGLWLTQQGDARIRIARCGGALCGSIAWLREPIDRDTGRPAADDKNPDPSLRTRPLIGLRIAHDMRPGDTPDKWTGLFYNSDDGQTYRGSLTLTAAGTLRAEGCLGPFCSAETWQKVR